MGSYLSTEESSSCNVDYDLLQEQNAQTSSAIIEYFSNHADFEKLSAYEGNLTVTRDQEDDEKLQKGIDFAKEKGVIDPNFQPEPYQTIDVLGKTPEQVAETILKSVFQQQQEQEQDSSNNEQAAVIVIVGLSGTGKGTTVAQLAQKLQQEHGKQVVTWSNGNIFRSVTLLAATWCEQNIPDKTFDAEKALTKENLQAFMKMLSFGKFSASDDGNDEKKPQFDTKIQGLGLDMLVSQVQNTELKQPKVSKNIPTVAEKTQGEVILFAADAVQKMRDDGWFVLLEGREQTVNYVRSPYRFVLTLSDESLIGKRRAAQRIMAAAKTKLEKSSSNDEQNNPSAIAQALESSLQEMVQEMERH